MTAPTLPGTAVAPPRRSCDSVFAAVSRLAPQIPDQGCLVEHWHEQGLLDERQRAELGGEQE
ncbi:hypothetical protein ACFQ9H_19355 [Streptomyces sp. NPDC056517]|uniref:hypothetical protein n=1 Tax=Streptomyces sp. NPDC056517 TaxID=3345848 RepID=UPI0036CF807F